MNNSMALCLLLRAKEMTIFGPPPFTHCKTEMFTCLMFAGFILHSNTIYVHRQH